MLLTDAVSARPGGKRTASTATGAGIRATLALGLVALLAAAAGAALEFPGGAPALAAQPVSSTLAYTCTGYPITMRIEADIPSSARVGVPTPEFEVGAVTTVGAAAVQGARLLGVRTIEGTGQAKITVDAPQGDIPVTVAGTIPKTSVPASGSAALRTTGVVPSLRFTRPGRGKITVGDLVLHIVPRDARGNLTVLGKLDLTCKLNSGQNNVLASFEIVNPTTGPTTSGPAGPTQPRATTPAPKRTAGPSTTETAGPAAPDRTTGSTAAGTASAPPGPTTGGATGAIGGAGGDGTTAPTGPTGSTGGDGGGTTATAGTTGTTGLGVADLVLSILGLLAVAATATGLRVGPRLRSRLRPVGIDD